MTRDEAFNIFFQPLRSRTVQCKTIKPGRNPRLAFREVHRIMCPEDLVVCIAEGADALMASLGEPSCPSARAAISELLDKASYYSRDSLMPLWSELDEELAHTGVSSFVGKAIGDFSGIFGMEQIGEALGEIFGAAVIGQGRGDDRSYNLSEGTASLIRVAQIDFREYVWPALLEDLG